MTTNGKQEKEVLNLDGRTLLRAECLERVDRLLDAVLEAAQDYFNSTPIVTLSDRLKSRKGIEMGWSCPIDLKTVSLVSSLAQAPLVLRGGTDRGKTALAERVLTGLFGKHGEDWWRMEINRGLSIDDVIDIDIDKLSRSKLSQAIESATWLGKSGRLLDEVNRVHAKLSNLVLHLADGTGFNVRGDLSLPVGRPYRFDEQQKRYSFTIATANHLHQDYAGAFEEDVALTRRLVVSIDMDQIPPSPGDITRMLASRRAKTTLPSAPSHEQQVIEVYEALPDVVPFSACGYLLMHYFAGMSTCVRSRSGRLQPQLNRKLCAQCHLDKSRATCGRIGGLTEGLMLWVRDLATALAAVRAALVFRQVGRDCKAWEQNASLSRLQRFLETDAIGEELLDRFRVAYLEQLKVTDEDVAAAYVLAAPTHVWIDPAWLKDQARFEANPFYVFRHVARDAWRQLLGFLKTHTDLARKLASGEELTPADQNEIETVVTTEDAALLAVIGALRDQELPLQFRDELRDDRLMMVA
jgi:MoxR-like ATPase